MTDNEFKYWAFLGYSQQDNCQQRPGNPEAGNLCWGDWVQDALKAFEIPADFIGQINARGELIPGKIDPLFHLAPELPDNGSLNPEDRTALEQSRYLVVICSPHSAQSTRLNEAVAYFKQLGRGNRILPIVVAGEPNASDGDKPGISPEAECFVPAMRHPVKPDGTLDTTQRERGYIFADARHGTEKREILAADYRSAENELEIAKIQLIAGLIGVGFIGLLRREQKRRFTGFAEAQYQAREAQNQLTTAQQQAQEAQGQLLALQAQARETQSQLETARQQAREAQNQVLDAQNLAPDVKSQIQEAQNQAYAAQDQAREAQRQLQEFQTKAQETQTELETARNQAQVAENKVLEAQQQAQAAQSQLQTIQQQARETLSQLEIARQQAREAQNQVLEIQNQARAVEPAVPEAPAVVLENQAPPPAEPNLVEAAQQQTRAAELQAQEAQQQAQAALLQVQELQTQAQQAQSQVETARSQAQTAEGKVLETQQQAQEALRQVQEFQAQAQQAQRELEAARNQVQETESKVSAAEKLAQAAQEQVRELQTQIQQTQSQVEAARHQARDAQKKVLETQGQAQATQSKAQSARRLTQVFAVIAVLALLAAGTAASFAFRQRKPAAPVVAQAVATEAKAPEITPANTNVSVKLDADQIRQTLQKWDRVDDLAAQIPTEEIPTALQAASTLDSQQRNRFQKQLLLRLAEVTPLLAMTNASALDEKQAKAETANASGNDFQLTVLDSWTKTDLPAAFAWARQLTDVAFRKGALKKIISALPADQLSTNTLAQLNDLKPAPGESVFKLFFQRWATNDPVQAIQQRQQVPDQDAYNQILNAIVAAWMNQQPEAALAWVKSQPDSETKNQALATCIEEQAKTDFPKAFALATSLPEGIWRKGIPHRLIYGLADKDLDAATTAFQQLPDDLFKEYTRAAILSKWIEKDPAMAAALTTNLMTGDLRQRVIEDLCIYWADTNAPAAVTWALTLPAEIERTPAVNQVVTRWARKDPAAAQQFASQHPELTVAVVGEIAAAWAQRDLTATTNWVASLPAGEKKDAALLGVATSTVTNTPQLAAEYCTQLTTNQPPQELVQTIANALAQNNLTNALTWAHSLTNEVMQSTAISGLSETWAQHDPKGLATYALSLPAGDSQTQYLKLACRELAQQDLPGMVELLQPLADATLRQNILEQAGHDSNPFHWDQTVKYVLTLPNGDAQKAIIKGLLASQIDPESAANWLRSFPENNPQTESLQSILKTWAQAEPAAAAKWLANLPAGTTNENLATAFLEGALVKYPEFAAQWTQSVTDEAQRQKFQLQVARQWLKTDAAAATKWIDSLNVPEETKQALKAPAP